MVMLLLTHFVAAMAAPFMIRRWGASTLYALALVPASSAAYAAAQTTAAFGQGVETTIRWVPLLDLELAFRLDALSWLLALIVGGVGALVLVYSGRYFHADAAKTARFGGMFLGFSGAMLGVVLSDHTLGFYVFWELTSVMSFLLIGFHYSRKPARNAARQALLVTGGTALAMFAGFVMLGATPGGSYRFSTLIPALRAGTLDPTSPLVVTAGLLILLGAFAKSAQVPFHFWLPGAMAAPTPVSAYLHAAAMVKAGVYLIMRIVPGATLIPSWSAIAVTVGFATMIVGAYRALKQRDLKLILAYGTVSQLGLMTAAAGFGSAPALAAAAVILTAHSLFKSSLFLTVGAVESSTGTRDLWELSGLAKKLPWLAAFAGLAALSMAGVPVTTGYLGKEAFVSTLFHGSGAAWTTGRGWVDPSLLTVLVVGSALSIAYAWRFWWGAFGTKDIRVTMTVKPVPFAMSGPIGVLALGALLGVAPQAFQLLGQSITQELPGHVHVELWSGLGPALLTALIVIFGAALAFFRPVVSRLQRATTFPIAAVHVYAWLVRELEVGATRITALMQRGSLPAELATIFTAAIVVAFYGLQETDAMFAATHLWDSPLQLGIVIVGSIAAIITVTSLRRTRAVLAVGAVGMTVSLLFASYGAPDLALTQMAVEAVSVVVFILVLRKLPSHFSHRPLLTSRFVKLLIAIGAGAAFSIGGYFAFSARIHDPASALMPLEALNFGYGHNIVNVILVDIRAWDTVGELSVLLVTATGVASLIYIVARTGKISRQEGVPAPGAFIAAGKKLKAAERSTVLEVSTRLLFPTMIMLSLWLLLVGHDNPGGGFAGGVVAGLAFVLRYLAGGRYELGEAMPIPASYLLGTGLFVAAAGGAMPLVYGRAVLQSTPIEIPLGGLGTLHLTTAMVLDIGVYLLVLGLIIDLVSALGAEIDRQQYRQDQRLKKEARSA